MNVNIYRDSMRIGDLYIYFYTSFPINSHKQISPKHESLGL